MSKRQQQMQQGTMNPRPDIQAAPPFQQNWLLQSAVIGLAVTWTLLALYPKDRGTWLIENILVFIAVGTLIWTSWKFRFSNASYILITFFLVLHSIGAHYTYTQTPVDEWLKPIFPHQRNVYDRIVHIFFGLLLVYPAYEVLIRTAKSRGFWSYVLPVSLILSLKSIYEIIEMWAALLMEPASAEAFVGIQGDPWDSVHDIEAGLYGALLTISAIGIVRAVKKRRRRSAA